MRVNRRGWFVLTLIVLFGYEAYALFVRESGLTSNEPRRGDLHLTREVNADTPLSQTFMMHADALTGVELFARPSQQPAVGPVEVVVSQHLSSGWEPVTRAAVDVSSIDLVGSGSMLVTTPRVETSAGGLFRVDVSMPRAAGGQGLRFLAGGPTYSEGSLTLGGREEWGDLKFRTRAARATVQRNLRQARLAWPEPFRSDAFWVIALVALNWGLATAVYYLAFAPADAREAPLSGAGAENGSALTTADQPRV